MLNKRLSRPILEECVMEFGFVCWLLPRLCHFRQVLRVGRFITTMMAITKPRNVSKWRVKRPMKSVQFLGIGFRELIVSHHRLVFVIPSMSRYRGRGRSAIFPAFIISP